MKTTTPEIEATDCDLPSKKYFRECLERHKAMTGDTNKMIVRRIPSLNAPNFITMIASPNDRSVVPKDAISEYVAAIPTLDRATLLALLLGEQIDQAAFQDLLDVICMPDRFRAIADVLEEMENETGWSVPTPLSEDGKQEVRRLYSRLHTIWQQEEDAASVEVVPTGA